MGQTYPLFGAQEMSFPEMADEVGHLLGKPVQYRQVDVPTLKQLAKDNGKEFGDFFWQHLSEAAVDHQEGVFAGEPHMTLDAFVEKHRPELTA